MLTGLLIIFLFVFPTFLRYFNITKDRPKTYEVDTANHDEGSFVHNARNKALFGKWILDNDDWNPIFLYPSYTYVWYLFFKLFGVGIVQGRLLGVIFGLLSLILFYKTVKKGYDQKTAVIATLFLSYNFILIMFHSSMMLETFMMFFIILTFYFWEIAIRKHKYLFLVGFSSFLAVIAKASSIWIIGTCILSLIPLLLQDIMKKNFASSKNQKIVFYFLTGLIVCILLFLVFFFIPNLSYIKLNLIDNQIGRVMGKTPVPLIYEVSTILFNTQFILRVPIASILAFIYTIYFVTNLPKNFKEADYMDFFVLSWIFFMFVYFFIFDSPLRRMIAMIPALAVFSARTILNIRTIFENKKEKNKFKYIFKTILVFTLIYMVIANIIMYGFKSILKIFHPALMKILSILSLNLPPFASNALDATISVVFAFILAGIILFFVRKTKLNLALTKKIRRIQTRKIIILVVMLSILIDLGQYASWSLRYDDSFYRASRELGQMLPENEKVYGMFSTGLSIENKIIPVYHEVPLINHKNRFERDDIRYILIVLKSDFHTGEREVAEFKEYYPKLKLIRIFYINDAEGTEIGLFDKFPEKKIV